MAEILQIVIKGDATQFTRTVQQVEAGIKRAQRSTQQFGHSTVSSVQAASASIRLLEGGIQNNVRAVERFVATIPGVGSALKAAFPVVGAIAFAGIIAHTGEELVKFIQTAQKIPESLARGWSEINTSGELANDELRKTNDGLANSIAKLEGKPQNNLSIAIDDARIAADKLVESVSRGQQTIEQLLKTNSVGWLQGLVTGQYQTKGTEGGVNYWERELAQRTHAYNQAVHQYGPDSDQARAAQTTYNARLADAQKDISRRIGNVNTWKDQKGRTANLNDLEGYQDYLNQLRDSQSLNTTNTRLTQKQQTLEHGKELADAQKQAQQLIIQQLRADFDQAKSVREMTTNDEANWWIGRLAVLKSGSQSYKTTLDEARKLMATQQGENLRLQQEQDKATGDYYSDSSHFDQGKDLDQVRYMADQGKAAGDWLKSLNAAPVIQQQNANAFDEAATKIALANGQMSEYDAAQQMASLHTREYTDALNRLQTSLKAIADDPTLSDLQRKAGLTNIQNQIAALNGQRAVQVAQDQNSINGQTVSGAFQNTLGKWVQESTNVADQLHILTDALDSVNQSLASSLMAHTHNGHEYRQGIENGLANSLRGTGTSLLNSSFRNIEGGVLSHFGIGGKADGSSSANALWVRMAGTGSGSASSTALGSWISRLFGGGKSSGSDPDDSSWISDSGFQGAFASGGDVIANRPALIGERGPEMFIPSSAGRIVPNDTLGGTNHVYVDARGATDEAAITQAVHRAIGQYAPGTVSASVAAMVERQKRVPLSRR